jgi:hypothetical protein
MEPIIAPSHADGHALIAAAAVGDLHTVQHLIGAATANNTLPALLAAKDHSGSALVTALDAAAGLRGMCSVDILKALISAGADVAAPNSAGQTPLHRAVHSATPAAVALLLTSGASATAAAAQPVLLSRLAGSSSLHSTPLAAAALDAVHTGSHAVLDVFLERMNQAADVDAEALVVAAVVAGVADICEQPHALLHCGFDVAYAFAHKYEQERRCAVRKLLLAAANHDAAATRSALQLHLPVSKRACVLLARVCMEVWLEAGAAAEQSTQQQAVSQMLLSGALSLAHNAAP